MTKKPIKKIGDKCRHCDTPVIKKESKYNKGKDYKKYYFTAYLRCPLCKAIYQQEKWKVWNLKVKPKPENKPKKKKKKLKIIRYTKENYKKYLKTRNWKATRNRMIIANPRCFVCNNNASQIHHCCYTRIGKEKKKDLVSLCGSCHQEIHNLILNHKNIKLKDAHKIYKQLYSLQI
jgi:hypothetical protein